MFRPLTNNKNNTIEVDRFDNSGITADTTDKANGLSTASQPTTFGTDLDGTIVVSAFPNSDYITSTGGGQAQYFLFTAEGTSCSTWFGLSIPTADNMLNIGSYTNYSPYLGTSGVLKGQLGVAFRQRPNCGDNRDGIILINSGSIYDWDNPTPITIAYSVDMTAGTVKCSVNGETANILQLNRDDGKPDATEPMFFSNIMIGSANRNGYLAQGFSPEIRKQTTSSGSFSEFCYYTSSLNQDELNTIAGQRYGDPTNVLDKQPQIRYRYTEENKTDATQGPSVPHQLNGNTAYINLGTYLDSQADVTRIKTIKETANMSITSGSVYDMESRDYKTRI